MSYVIKSETLKNIADAIRAKTGKSGDILVSNFATEILSIPEPEIFDGTINIESGLTMISGDYVINQQKAYDALQALITSKTYSAVFGAGGPAGGGDEMGFNSMTFDATNDWIKYDDITAFTCAEYMNGGDGFAGYNDNGGTGNGARVNFADGTEVRKEFKELFLSIADVLITFTIDGTSYLAVEGMNWGDWTQSDYNTGGYMPAEYVYNTDGSKYISGVTPTDVIVEGMAYTLVNPGGGNGAD